MLEEQVNATQYLHYKLKSIISGFCFETGENHRVGVLTVDVGLHPFFHEQRSQEVR